MPNQTLENNNLFDEAKLNNSTYRPSNQGGEAAYLYSPTSTIVQIVSLLLIIGVGLAGNIYVCAVVYKHKNFRNPTFIFIVNLSIANIGALLLCTPFPLIVSTQNTFVMGKFWCCASGFLNNFFFCASIFTLLFITMHKYFSVIRPSAPRWLHVNEKKAKVLVVILWITCGTLSFIFLGPFDDWSYIVFNVTTAHCGIAFPKTLGKKLGLTGLALLAFVIPVLIMSYAYWRIYMKVTTHARRMSETINTHDHVSPLKRKLAVTLCLMFTTFVACWLPFFLLIALAIGFDRPSQLPYHLGRIAYWFGYFNCAINPAIYCLRTSAFREGLKRRKSPKNVTCAKATRRSRRAFSLPAALSTNSYRSPARKARKNEPQMGLNVVTIHSALSNQRRNTLDGTASTLATYTCSRNSGYYDFKNEASKQLSCRRNNTSPVDRLYIPHISTLGTKRRQSHEPSLEPVEEMHINTTSLDDESSVNRRSDHLNPTRLSAEVVISKSFDRNSRQESVI